MLAEQLELALPELEIVEIISSHALNNAYLKNKRIDLIISTISIGSFKSPVVCISLPLRQDDIAKVRRLMEDNVDVTSRLSRPL